MSRSIFTCVLAGLMMLLSSDVVHAQQQQPLGVIAIDWGYESAEAPRRNPELIYKTLKAAFADTLKRKLNVENPATVADLEMMNEGRNIRLVIVSKGAVQPTADEVMAMVKDSFLEVVNNFISDYHAKEIAQMRDADMNQLDEVRRRARQAQDVLAKLRSNLRAITHRVDVSPETLRAAITRLEDERDKLALDTESMTVRKKAIEDTIAEISAKSADQMKRDRVAVELDKLIVSREVEVKRMQQLATENNVSRADVEAAEGRLGEARVRLWERQEIVNRTAGGEVLADLNKELAMLSINSFESEHRLKRLQKAVDDYAKAVDFIDELENAQAARAAAQQQLVEAENFANEHGRNFRNLPPPTVNFHARGGQ